MAYKSLGTVAEAFAHHDEAHQRYTSNLAHAELDMKVLFNRNPSSSELRHFRLSF
jgi:hypothetical protein